MATTTPGFATTISLAKQTAQGTANVPSSANLSANTGYSLRWLQGSKVRPHADFKQEQEGDGSRAESLNYKTGQWATGKTICYARPLDAAMLFAALSGHGSDSHSGSAPPYTHLIEPAVTSAQNDYYTLLQTVGKGSGTVHYQAVDAVCNKIVVSSGVSSNVPLKLDCDWVGGANSQGTGAFTPSLSTDGPFYWWSSSWSVPSDLRGSNAAWETAIRDFTLTFECELMPGDFIADAVTPLPLTVGNLKVSGDITLLWQDGGLDAAAYFAGGSSDSPVVATADLSVTFLCSTDSAQTFTIDLPAASWTMADFDPDLSGKPVEQKASLAGLRGSGGNPYAVTILNSANVAY